MINVEGTVTTINTGDSNKENENISLKLAGGHDLAQHGFNIADIMSGF